MKMFLARDRREPRILAEPLAEHMLQHIMKLSTASVFVRLRYGIQGVLYCEYPRDPLHCHTDYACLFHFIFDYIRDIKSVHRQAAVGGVNTGYVRFIITMSNGTQYTTTWCTKVLKRDLDTICEVVLTRTPVIGMAFECPNLVILTSRSTTL